MNACASRYSTSDKVEKTMHILLIDDDRDIAHALKDMFEIHYEDAMVDVVLNITDTHAYIRKHSPDIFLIDVKLGTDNGLDLVPFIKKSHPHSACIMMTAFRETDYAIKALRVGADDYVLKPIEPTHLFKLIDNIRAQKALERERDELDNRFRAIFEQSFQINFILDDSGKILDSNQAALQATGLNETSLLNTYFSHADWWVDSADATNKITHSLSEAMKGNSTRIELDITNPEGVALTFDFSLKPVPDNSNNISIIFAEGRNVSLQKNYEKKISNINTELEERVKHRTIALERASAAKSDFLSRMSHELRTPLNIILGYAQILEMHDDQLLSEEQRDCVNEIHQAGDHLLSLVNDVLDLTRAEQNKLMVTLATIDLSKVIRESVNMLAVTAQKQNMTITISSGDHIAVVADLTRLKQVLVNLVGNALKYGGNVDINYALTTGGMVRINVTDDGPGINAKKQSLLFIPFERLGAEKNTDGTGIGLVICEHLVHLMKGNIGVDSSPGKGSTFWFELPCALPSEPGQG